MSEHGSGVNRRRFLTISGSLLGGIAAGSTVVVAESEDRFLVDTKGVDEDELADAVEVVHDLGAIDAAVVRGAESDVEGVADDYEVDAEFTIQSQTDGVEGASDAPPSPTDEPFYPLQWDKQSQDVETAHEVTQGEGARVAVVDTGVDTGHPDLAGALNEDLSRGFTDAGEGFEDVTFHGTHVTGIALAADNGEGVVGIAPEAELVALRALNENVGGTFGDVLAAVVYSAEVGCDVTNLSLGAYPIPRRANGKFYGGLVIRTTNYANAQGTLLVAAAGNEAADLQKDGNVVSLPNEAPNVMSVSATSTVGFDPTTGESDEPAWTPTPYTNYGTNAIDVSAPGGGASGDRSFRDAVISTIPRAFGMKYGYLAGTSMACPQVAGAAALVKSQNPNYNPAQLRRTIERTARDVGKPGADPYHGKGFLDTAAAVSDGGKGNGNGNGKGN